MRKRHTLLVLRKVARYGFNGGEDSNPILLVMTPCGVVVGYQLVEVHAATEEDLNITTIPIFRNIRSHQYIFHFPATFKPNDGFS
jgi:hypothetical protein